MRVLQVVTLISPDGAYGGPARVALNQSAALIRRGHTVTLAAGTRGYKYPPARLEGVPIRLFASRILVPRIGFGGVGAPAMGPWFRRHRTEFDVVHIHLGRDLTVLPFAVAIRRHRIPYTLQTHGMVVPSDHPLAAPVDTMWTRKVLKAAGTVFYLTPLEREQLISVGGSSLRLVQLENGVPLYPARNAGSRTPEVLFVARMHPRKRPRVFVEMAHRLLDEGVAARFTLVGPDEGEGDTLRQAIGADERIVWEGALDPAAIPSRMADADIFVLPSVREPYPMSLLEAMSVGLPVVVQDDCGLAPAVGRAGCGLVVGPSTTALATAVRTLLDNPPMAQDMGRLGRVTVSRDFGLTSIAHRLETTFSTLVGEPS